MIQRILLLAAIAASFTAVAQSEVIPPGFYIPSLPEVVELNTFDHDLLLEEDLRTEQETGKSNSGRLAYTSADPTTHGEWHMLENGDQIWRMRFRTEGAAGVAGYFENFHMPVGAYLFAYDAARTWVDGPYDYTENNDHGRFSTGDIPGDELVLEIYLPFDAVGQPTLGLFAVGHTYRHVHFYEADRGSDPCEVDVNCPEGDDWVPQRDSVVRLRIVDQGVTGYCSGVLVNTTEMDCRQYLLTALHCADGVSDNDFLSLRVLFNYERSGCASGGAPSTRSRTGVIHLADSDDNGGQFGSDFLLVEVEDEIPLDWNPYYAGWDATGAGSDSGVSIHHPGSDVKKISTYTDDLDAVFLGAFNSHWRVFWSETETNHGVTEGGSSGSPIFNEEGLVIGNLTGGSSFCTAPNDPDYYGRMSHHWTNNPNNANQKLKVWLDPDDTGIEVMFGAYAPNCAEDVNDIPELTFQSVQIFPNPANDVLKITVDASQDVERVDMYDAQGRMVYSAAITDALTALDISEMAPGVYHLTFLDTHGQQLTKKVVIQ